MSDNNKKEVSTNKEETINQEGKDIEILTQRIKLMMIRKKKLLNKNLKNTEDKLLRSLAELENQRRRFEKEIKDAFDYGSFNFARESLAILDNLQRAKEAIKNDNILKENKDLEKFIENITIIEKDLISIFEKNKIKKLKQKAKKFDPNLHQAMAEIEDDKSEAGTIINEIQGGYMLGDRLLRPALVGVSKEKKSQKNKENKQKKGEADL